MPADELAKRVDWAAVNREATERFWNLKASMSRYRSPNLARETS